MKKLSLNKETVVVIPSISLNHIVGGSDDNGSPGNPNTRDECISKTQCNMETVGCDNGGSGGDSIANGACSG